MVNQFTIFLAVYLIADAIHDKLVIEGRAGVTSTKKEQLWHLVDSLIKGFISMYFLYLMGQRNIFQFVLYSSYFMFFRSVWFNLWLNVFRDNVRTWHLSKNPKTLEGKFNIKNLGWLYWLLGFIGTVLLYLTLNYYE